MDPYLESHWGDVHTSLVTYARDQLRPQLPDDLRPRVEERVFVETDEGLSRRSIYPDVRVVERPFGGNGGYVPSPGGGVAVAVAEPIIIEFVHEPKTERFIEIRDIGSGGRVVTVIEFVSPSNKLPGEGRKLYLKKQRELDEAGVNSVEIDLVRTGENVIAAASERLPPEFRTPYRICARRATRPDAVEAYRVPLREPLPTIRVPLRASENDVTLNLQALIEQCYANAGYDDIDYTQPPIPPLEGEDAKWAATLLTEKGRRGA
jgi:hypothetical protein